MSILLKKTRGVSEQYSIEDLEWEIPKNCPVKVPDSEINKAYN